MTEACIKFPILGHTDYATSSRGMGKVIRHTRGKGKELLIMQNQNNNQNNNQNKNQNKNSQNQSNNQNQNQNRNENQNNQQKAQSENKKYQ